MTGRREVVRNTGLIAACWAALVFELVWTLVAIVSSDHGPSNDIVLGMTGLVGAAGFHRATRMRIEMNDTGLAVHRLFRTEYVAWRDVRAVSVDLGGLHIARPDGRTATASSMARSTWTAWLRRDAPDRWVRRIEARAEAERQMS